LPLTQSVSPRRGKRKSNPTTPTSRSRGLALRASKAKQNWTLSVTIVRRRVRLPSAEIWRECEVVNAACDRKAAGRTVRSRKRNLDRLMRCRAHQPSSIRAFMLAIDAHLSSDDMGENGWGEVTRRC
jgi:hypothetical protein